MKPTIASLLFLCFLSGSAFAQSSYNAAPSQGIVVTKPYFGAEFNYQGKGAEIKAITPYSPAEVNYFRVGDVITTMDNRTISSAADMEAAMNSFKPESVIIVGYTRKGKAKTKKVRLEKIKVISEAD